MKIFGLLDNYDVPDRQPAPGSAEAGTSLPILYFPDVALLASGKPFFIPPGGDRWELYPSVAIRISRLGKSIASKFASRYYTEAAFGFNIRNRTLLDALRSRGLPWTEATGSDYSTPLGRFMPVERLLAPDTEIRVGFTDRNGAMTCEPVYYRPSLLRLDADHAVEAVSRRFTLKDGDIIFLGFPTEGSPVGTPGSIHAELGDETLIITKIR